MGEHHLAQWFSVLGSKAVLHIDLMSRTSTPMTLLAILVILIEINSSETIEPCNTTKRHDRMYKTLTKEQHDMRWFQFSCEKEPLIDLSSYRMSICTSVQFTFNICLKIFILCYHSDFITTDNNRFDNLPICPKIENNFFGFLRVQCKKIIFTGASSGTWNHGIWYF